MNTEEEKTWRGRYSYCRNIEEKDDLIFAYPDGFGKNPSAVAEDLQKSMNFLKSITNLDPTGFFHQRTVVGYRHPNDEGGRNCQPGWLPNWVNIPWSYLEKHNEPQDACSHELVHPFYRISPLHNSNEGWGEGFCDFLRGPIKNLLGLAGNEWWKQKIDDAHSKKDDRGGNAAGQFILKAQKKYGSVNETTEDFVVSFINNRDAIRKYISFLFSYFSDRRLSDCECFTPTSYIRQFEDRT